ncbi:MAG: gliding motility protein GldL, partial [Bacteroidales bacterium]|nr:gliding motility protein GldL [Bacteroidales bacterium]
MSLAKIVQSRGFKNLLTKLYGFGASVVIIGTLFKIQHWRFADLMLAVGLITESIIFFFYAFEPEVDWSLAYPELAETPEDKAKELSSYNGKHRGTVGGGGGGSVALAKFDEMLEKAEITPDLLQKLGVGMKKLGETTANM